MAVKKSRQKIKKNKKRIKAVKIRKRVLIAKKKKKVKSKKSANPQKKAPDFTAQSFFKAKIKVIGIGGGGGSIVSEIGRSLQKATFVVADTDSRVFKKKSGIRYFWFGASETHGLGTGLNPELARELAEKDKENISNLFKDQDIVILIASLGGGVGSGAAQVFAEKASSSGAITLGIFTLPFKFEGKKKSRIALRALKELRRNLNVSLAIPNERIFKIVDKNTSITQAFSFVNKKLIESLESLIDLIYNPGLINIDFADLRTILKGRGNLGFLNTAEESGKDRAEQISKSILHNQLYQNSNFEPEKILFNISGGQNLSMFEVEKISTSISAINPNAKIIFGISKNPSFKNKIKAVLLTTGAGQKTEIAEPKQGEAKKSAKTEAKKPSDKKKKAKAKKTAKPEKKILPQPAIPVFNKIPVAAEMQSRLNVVETAETPSKKTIRRNALEIKKAEADEENKRMLQEKEWEIPAFLRKVKFKS